MTTLVVDKILPKTGTSITLGDSGDTFTNPSGASIECLGTATNFGTAGIVGVKTTQYADSKALSGSGWQHFDVLDVAYTAASTSNRLLLLCQCTIAISGTSVVFKFRNATAGTDYIAPANSNRAGSIARSHCGGTSWGMTQMFSHWVTPANTSSNTYQVHFWDHNAGGIRVNSNHDNADSGTADRSRAISQLTIMEFGSNIV